MSVFQHHVLAIPPKQHGAIAHRIKSAGASAIAAHGGRLFGIWKPLLGLSLNHLIVLAEWPNAEAAIAHGAEILGGIEDTTVELGDPGCRHYGPRRGVDCPNSPAATIRIATTTSPPTHCRHSSSTRPPHGAASKARTPRRSSASGDQATCPRPASSECA
jgi:hypothetical protein